jgi:hypothetical protein
MRKTKLIILLTLLILFSLALGACSSAPEEVETAPKGEIGLDGDWMHDETPPYPYAQAMRNRLDSVLDEAFGIAEVQYYVDDLVKVHGQGAYNVRYALKDVPQGEAFYYALEEVFGQAFNFYLFADMETAETYFEYYDELPEDISVAMEFEGGNYYWQVWYDGTYLGFFTF